MTSRIINDNVIAEIKKRIVAVESAIKDLRNNKIVTLPIRSNDNLPTEASDGQIVLGVDGIVYKYQDGEWAPISASGGRIETIEVPGFLTTSTIDPTRAYQLVAGTISSIHLSVGTAPVGASLGVRVRKNGSSIGTGSIASGAFTGSITPSGTSVSVGDYFTIDITSVGTTYPGNSLVVRLAIS